MNENSIYSQIILSKSGIEIPILKNGKSVDSRYDPVRESQRLIEEIKKDTHFLIILGIASGTLINEILKVRKDIFILALEKSEDDLIFLRKLSLINKIEKNRQLVFCTINSLQDKITQYYLPAFYGNLQVLEQRGWTLENTESLETIRNKLNKAAGLVSADYSVQCHFGKLWQHNILANLLNIQYSNFCQELPLQKTAVIVAAGPSLDATIKILKENPDNYYIIATDTAFSVLVCSQLLPQAVISIDGQNISNVHFSANSNIDFSKILFLFDLCANSSAVNYVIKNKGSICFFTSGHPLSEFVNKKFSLGLTSLFSGAGTVTISALDFAIKAGFKKHLVLAADFSYSNGKPYAKGTYLDRLYNQKSNKIQTLEKNYMTLEFRTELIKEDKTFSTQILKAYRASFENYLQTMGCKFKKEKDIYEISSSQIETQTFTFTNHKNSNGKALLYELQEIFAKKSPDSQFNSIFELNESDISLLPLISWLRNHDNIDRDDFNYFYKKALLLIKALGGN